MWAARGSTGDPASVLHGFLSAWLAMHILGEDQSTTRQLTAVRDGVDAEVAYSRELAHQDNATAALLLSIKSLYRVMARQNAGLVQANQLLEARVLQRTAALAQANADLTDLNVKLQDMSHRDGLLGIANRRRFDEQLPLEWRRAARARSPLSLLMIDVDHFKRYNDLYGHPAGDRCLQAVAQAVAAATAKRPADLLARYGGEELVVLLPDTPAEGALVVAREVLQAVHALHLAHADSPVAAEVTVSIGTATLNPAPDFSPDALLLQADASLYAAKAEGRNRVVAGRLAATAVSVP
jgi:hemerythrin